MAVTLPTLYEYYTSGGIQAGLSADQPYFTLNNKSITIYSGAMHYFRVPKPYWRDRLRKMRAAGLNAVETYVPWNLHEPQSGQFDFGKGSSDMEDFLDVEEFLKTAQEEDLLAIVRPGPYICAEWEFGGFPSWLLRNKDIKVRTSDSVYMNFVKRYFNVLLPILALLQFTKGGPIIAFQVENEYGNTRSSTFTPDREYLEELREIMLNNSIVELLFTSDSPTGAGDIGTLPGVLLQTANFGSNPEAEFDALKKLQKDKPVMAMEYYPGWFDHWSEQHHVRSDSEVRDVYERILKYPASVNMYMFHGGTSFGFMNGANSANGATDNSGFQPDTTSYDYDAPLSEIGDYTTKYAIVKELIEKYNPIKTKIPDAPPIANRTAYPSIQVTEQLPLADIVNQVDQNYVSRSVISMEELPVNNGSGQSYGYIVYRTVLPSIVPGGQLMISGHVCDTVTVLTDGVLMSKPLKKSSDLDGFGFWRVKDSKVTLSNQNLTNSTVDLMVENWGRVNFGNLPIFQQYKGLWQGEVSYNGIPIREWIVYPIDFKKSWTTSLTGWMPYESGVLGPHLYKAMLTINGDPVDTFVDMQEWTKGIVIVNGSVLGRYARIGPQQTLYLPAPFLKNGENEILVFEHYESAPVIRFSEKPVYKTV